jgi:CRISPR system Cascade subunit CasD
LAAVASATFLFRIAGAMQSWGTGSRFLVRDTGAEPSKSALIGLLCAALGKPREEQASDRPRLAELCALRLGVRADREGEVRLDFQTAGGSASPGGGYAVIRADGSAASAVLSRRYYLADAEFLVGIEGEEALLTRLAQALCAPRWQLFLGRKAFPPSAPINLPGVAPWAAGWRRGSSLLAALASCPWLGGLAPRAGELRPARLRIVVDDPCGLETRRDVPLSFSPRRFSIRRVTSAWVAPQEQDQ